MTADLRITRIVADNFKNIHHGILDLSADGTHLITGDNGTGKTTFLDAALFALFGLQGHAAADYIPTAAAENTAATATVDFTTDGADHTVTRTITRTIDPDGQPHHRVTGTVTTDGVTHTGLTPAKITPRIEALIGMTAGAFTSATFIRQGDVASLATATPATLEQTIEHFTGLHNLTRARTDARANALTAEKTADALPGSATDVTDCKERLDAAAAAVTDATTAVTDAETTATDAADKHRAAEAEAHDLATAHTRHVRLASEADHTARALTTAHTTVDDLTTAAGDDDPTALDAQLTALTGRRDRITDLATTAATTAADLHRAEDAAASAGARVTTARQHVNTTQADVTQKEETLTTAQADQTAADGEITRLTTAIEDTRQQHADHTARATAAATTATDLAAAITAITQATTTSCPTCQTTLDDPTALLDKLRDQQHTAEADQASARAAADESAATGRRLASELADLRSVGDRVAEADRNLAAAQASAAAARQTLTAAETAAQEAKNTADAATAAHTTATDELAEQLQDYDITTAATTDPLDAAREAYRQISAHGRDIQKRLDTLSALTAARKDLARRQQDYDDATARLGTAPDDDTLAAAQASAAAARQTLTDAETELSQARTMLSGATAAHLTIDTEFAHVTEQWEAKRTAHRKALVARGVATVLAAVRSDLIHTVCHTVGAQATSILQSLSDEYGSLTIGEDFTITITRRDGQPHSTRSLSTGEQIIAGLALRIGISVLVTGGNLPSQVIADEIDDGLDAGTRARAVALLAGQFDNVVLITHTPDFTDAPADDHPTTVTTHHLSRSPLGMLDTTDPAADEADAA
jgi:DNA repair exonuclease SbcCD ATPase subunit